MEFTDGTAAEKNPAESLKRYLKSAEQGGKEAQNSLGYCYSRGEGIERDIAEALKWYREAAKQGDTEAKEELEKTLTAIEKEKEQ